MTCEQTNTNTTTQSLKAWIFLCNISVTHRPVSFSSQWLIHKELSHSKPIAWSHLWNFTDEQLIGSGALLNLTFRYLDMYIAVRFNQKVRQSWWIVFFRQDASRWWATTCISPKRKRGRLAAHRCLGHPHTFADPSKTFRKSVGQLLVTSSVEHAGEMRKAGGGKMQRMVVAICQHQEIVLLVWGEASLIQNFPWRDPIIPALSLKNFYYTHSPALL